MVQKSSRSDTRPAVVLLVEDNPADRNLARRVLATGVMSCDLLTVGDGEEALDYLYGRGSYADPSKRPRPDLILLDINMPRRDGFAVLNQLKHDPDKNSIPVVMLTTSNREEDIERCYALGCNSFITKPVEIGDFIRTLQELGSYWLKLVVLPEGD